MDGYRNRHLLFVRGLLEGHAPPRRSQVRLSTAEVMSIPLVDAAFFGANIYKTRLFLNEYDLHDKDDRQKPPQLPAARHRARPLAGALFARCWPNSSRSGTLSNVCG